MSEISPTTEPIFSTASDSERIVALAPSTWDTEVCAISALRAAW